MKIDNFEAGSFKRVSTTITRPSDTTQYAAGDAVNNSTSAPVASTFSGCARKRGGGGVVLDAVIISSAAQATKANLRLYLFNGAIPTATNDNSAFAPTDADMNKVIGFADFSSWEVGTSTAGAGGNCASFAKNLNIPFTCASAEKDLYGMLVERSTYTPVTGEIFSLRLGVLSN